LNLSDAHTWYYKKTISGSFPITVGSSIIFCSLHATLCHNLQFSCVATKVAEPEPGAGHFAWSRSSN